MVLCTAMSIQGSADMSTLVQIMCATFVENCPVYSKSAAPSRPSNQQYSPRPPYGSGAQQPSPNAGYGARMPYPQQQQPQARAQYGQGGEDYVVSSCMICPSQLGIFKAAVLT